MLCGAYLLGYTSEFAFADAFRREYGIAPGRYRRRDPREAGDRRERTALAE
jgi:AraC-like DNA-binding protein